MGAASCKSGRKSGMGGNYGNNTVYNFEADTIDGDRVILGDVYYGRVLLVVNVATFWGLTKQNYAELQQLTEEYSADNKFTVLGFPCNQFGNQEPGTAEEIKAFARGKKGATFPLFAKCDVNGDAAHPLYKYLKLKLPGILGTGSIKWNFTKFLIGKDGVPIKRFGPKDNPLSFKKDIIEELNKPDVPLPAASDSRAEGSKEPPVPDSSL